MFTQAEAIHILTTMFRSEHPNVEVGAGLDDVAVLRFGTTRIAITADFTNFKPLGSQFNATTLVDRGYLLIVHNVSDLLASGATPIGGVVALGLPSSLESQNIRDLADGIRLAADECHIAIVGGDTKEASQLILSATLFGELGRGGLWARGGAKAGDSIFVSGPIGGVSAAALALSHGTLGEAINDASASVLARPSLPLTLAGRLRSAGIQVAATDISDGLGIDSHSLADASKIGLEIRAVDIPLHPLVFRVANILNFKPWRLAFGLGGDGQFLFALNPRDEAAAIAAGGIRIGRALDSTDRILIHESGETVLPSFGHQDFTGESSMDRLLGALAGTI